MKNLDRGDKVDVLNKIYSEHGSIKKAFQNLVNRDDKEFRKTFLAMSHIDVHIKSEMMNKFTSSTRVTKDQVRKYLLKRYPPQMTDKIITALRLPPH